MMKSTYCLLLALCLAGCMSTPQSNALFNHGSESGAQASLNLPFFPQDEYQCGPAALATVLAASGVDVMPDDLVPLVYVPGRQGAYQLELMAAARHHQRLAYQLTPDLDTMLQEVKSGHPVLVMQNLGVKWYPRWHFAVVKGFDLDKRRLILNSGTRENYAMPLRTFERTWARAGHWAVVVTKPDQMPSSATPITFFAAVVALEHNHPQQALTAYTTGLERWPDDRNLLMGRGNLLYNLRQPEQALAVFRHAADRYPEYAPAHNNLAQVLYEQGHLSEAREHAMRAVEIGGLHEATSRSTLDMIEAAIH